MSSASVDESGNLREQLPQVQDQGRAKTRPSTIPLRLISFDETAPDPPYRPKFTARERLSPSRLPLFSRTSDSGTSDSGDSPTASFAEREELARESPAEFGDDEAGVVCFESEVAESDDYDAEDETLFASEAENYDDAESYRFTLHEDACNLFPMLYNDVLACISWPNAIILGAAAGGAIAIREHLDGDVREYTASRPQRWGEGTQVLRQFGEFSYQLPVIAAVYGLGLWTQDEHTHEFSKTLISAYSITALTTVAIKGATNTQRPTSEFQNGDYGFPSYHTASGFAIAAVVDEYYGWPAGLPCYAVAGLVGWSRIDQREHDLSDVFFGSILGFVIGKSVAAAHLDGITGCQVVPCFDPATRSFGAVFHKKY